MRSAAGVGGGEVYFQVYPEGKEFPKSRSDGGVSKAEVAEATRAYLKKFEPDKLIERVDNFMKDNSWALIWTPPYVPSFQPIELFLAAR